MIGNVLHSPISKILLLWRADTILALPAGTIQINILYLKFEGSSMANKCQLILYRGLLKAIDILIMFY